MSSSSSPSVSSSQIPALAPPPTPSTFVTSSRTGHDCLIKTFSTPSLPLTIEVHCADWIQQCSTFPVEIHGIFGALEPLPSWCSTGPYPFVSKRVLPLLHELSNPDPPTSPSGNSPSRLTEIFDLTLSTVADIRSLRAQYDSTPSALPFVLGLIRVLIHMCAEEAVILTDVQFVRPRTEPLDSRLDGVATILGCHIVESVVKDVPISPISPAALVKKVPMRRYPIPSAKTARATVRPLVFLPGRPTRGSYYSGENIEDVMASVTCQRYVWGITQPVVGFALSARGVEATLIISWLDPSTNVVHISRTAPDGPGIFDFTDAASTLAFSQFIENLGSHFAIIPTSNSGLRPTNTFDWRADITNIPSENFAGWRDRVGRWVCDVGMALIIVA
ncbi:hypothetical protein B0H13DRAFT_2455912 [Mycena leptocephala]|nr:hypothetical protein B0H13DRAFT_2455912 [Mycena leptocephala]